MKHIGRHIKDKVLPRFGLQQTEFGARLGWDAQQSSRNFSGRHEMKLSTLKMIADELQIPVSELIKGSNAEGEIKEGAPVTVPTISHWSEIEGVVGDFLKMIAELNEEGQALIIAALHSFHSSKKLRRSTPHPELLSSDAVAAFQRVQDDESDARPSRARGAVAKKTGRSKSRHAVAKKRR